MIKNKLTVVRKNFFKSLTLHLNLEGVPVECNIYCRRLEKYHTEVKNTVNQFPVNVDTKITKGTGYTLGAT